MLSDPCAVLSEGKRKQTHRSVHGSSGSVGTEARSRLAIMRAGLLAPEEGEDASARRVHFGESSSPKSPLRGARFDVDENADEDTDAKVAFPPYTAASRQLVADANSAAVEQPWLAHATAPSVSPHKIISPKSTLRRVRFDADENAGANADVLRRRNLEGLRTSQALRFRNLDGIADVSGCCNLDAAALTAADNDGHAVVTAAHVAAADTHAAATKAAAAADTAASRQLVADANASLELPFLAHAAGPSVPPHKVLSTAKKPPPPPPCDAWTPSAMPASDPTPLVVTVIEGSDGEPIEIRVHLPNGFPGHMPSGFDSRPPRPSSAVVRGCTPCRNARGLRRNRPAAAAVRTSLELLRSPRKK